MSLNKKKEGGLEKGRIKMNGNEGKGMELLRWMLKGKVNKSSVYIQ